MLQRYSFNSTTYEYTKINTCIDIFEKINIAPINFVLNSENFLKNCSNNNETNCLQAKFNAISK